MVPDFKLRHYRKSMVALSTSGAPWMPRAKFLMC